MAFKVNYNQQRMERERAKQAKKEAKLREQEAELMRRRNAPQPGDEPLPQDDAALQAEDKPNGTP
jgi:hypothetical protein